MFSIKKVLSIKEREALSLESLSQRFNLSKNTIFLQIKNSFLKQSKLSQQQK